MSAEASSFAALAAALGDPSRASMVLTLMDGRSWTAGELGAQAGIAPSTASAHLNLLLAEGVLHEERQGRHRYLRIATAGMAELIEDLASMVGAPGPTGSLRAVRAGAAMSAARTCYDHLAGRLGVDMFDSLALRGLLSVSTAVALTPQGISFLEDLGVQLRPTGSKRALVRSCVDWTERRPHLAGAAGAAVYNLFRERGWVRPAGGRALSVTTSGRRALETHFPADRTPPRQDHRRQVETT